MPLLCFRSFNHAFFLLLLLGTGLGRGTEPMPAGADDIVTVFARAAQGAPLRYVAMGGSITQPWIGDWLRQQFPQSAIYVQGTGISATGSSLGVFRLDRDVISYQPDLALIECVVNDASLSDEDAMRYFESEVVRLRKLPHPPAIILVIAGQEKGMHKERHLRIAEHYGVFVIDLDAVLHPYLEANKQPWIGPIMKDAVHPTDAGHALYSKWIAEKLQPLADKAKAMKADATTASRMHPLPAPVSQLPLLLDGRLVSLSEATGWKIGSVPNANWWNKFFTGIATASEPGTALRFPFRGTAIGLWYPLGDTFGSFYASVDGGIPQQILTNTRRGYDYRVFANHLEPCEHVLTVVLPQQEPANGAFRTNGEIDLGYALVAGESGSTRGLAKQGLYSTDVLKQLRFVPIEAKRYLWIGPFGAKVADSASGHASPDLDSAFVPEPTALAGKFSDLYQGPDQKRYGWQPLTGEDAYVDLAALTGQKDHGIVYAATRLKAAQEGSFLLRLTCDYYVKIWLNGQMLKELSGGHGGPHEPLLIPISLKAGWNDLAIKVHPGSQGSSFSISVGTLGPAVEPEIPPMQ